MYRSECTSLTRHLPTFLFAVLQTQFKQNHILLLKYSTIRGRDSSLSNLTMISHES